MSDVHDPPQAALAPAPDVAGPAPEADGATARTPGTVRRWWRRRGPKRAFIWAHRWSSLTLGLLLLIVATSGVPLLYQEEIMHVQHGEAYAPSAPAPEATPWDDVLAAVRTEDPDFAPQSLYDTDGVVIADDFESGRRMTVDPGSGEILGDFNPSHDAGVVPWTMSFLTNLHVCGLTCPEYEGYQSWLAEPVPGTGWLGFEGEPVTWGGLLLGIAGLLLLFLVLSGIWLWWPGVRRWYTGVRVRMRKGRYSRDYDLHQVAGMIALPLLLMWALTGMSYEFGFVEKAWYAVTPGAYPEERVFESKESKAPDIDIAEAIAIAQRHTGKTEPATSIDLPAADDPKATFGVWFSDGFDSWGKTEYAGDMLVNVDRHGGGAMVTYGGDQPIATSVYQEGNFPTHAGSIVGPWVRIIWLVLGLAPLLLAFTGLSTWLYKRSLRKRRRERATGEATSLGVTPAMAGVAIGYLAIVGVLSLLAAAGLRCAAAVRAGVIVAELILIVQAVLALIAIVGGHRPSEPATFAGYLAVSVILLPLLLGTAGKPLPGADGTRMSFLVVALACAVAAVVVTRLHATWS